MKLKSIYRYIVKEGLHPEKLVGELVTAKKSGVEYRVESFEHYQACTEMVCPNYATCATKQLVLMHLVLLDKVLPTLHKYTIFACGSGARQFVVSIDTNFYKYRELK